MLLPRKTNLSIQVPSTHIFYKHFEQVQDCFPKLQLRRMKSRDAWAVVGTLDIRGEQGEYRGSFEVGIVVSKKYPFTVPEVYELSEKIERNIDWHISSQGLCCLDMPHRLYEVTKRGIHFRDFISDFIYPYFANQLYKKLDGNYANGEWNHGNEGIVQFYREEMDIHDSKTAVKFLNAIISNNIPGRNDPCLCGNEKFKKCTSHFNGVQRLSRLSRYQLKYDLNIFETPKST